MIVGAGPVGVTAALLAQRGMHIVVLQRRARFDDLLGDSLALVTAAPPSPRCRRSPTASVPGPSTATTVGSPPGCARHGRTPRCFPAAYRTNPLSLLNGSVRKSLLRSMRR
ncbi:hypothetical protein [Streptomyces sp. NPDC001816]|uniref:hypothetical protein n=1 Tax=Streptomyces sp. NPDC001816 TaxID=3364612 RepID=UPI00369E1FE2